MTRYFNSMIACFMAVAMAVLVCSCFLSEKGDDDFLFSMSVTPQNALRIAQTRQNNSTPEKVLFPSIKLGFKTDRAEYDCSKMMLDSISGPTVIREEPYTAVSGKKSAHAPVWKETVLHFSSKENSANKLDVRVRIGMDGVAFRYELPKSAQAGQIQFQQEYTSYEFPEKTEFWAQRKVTSYEDCFEHRDLSTRRADWNYPLLFTTGDGIWGLISESNIDGTYCASRLRYNGDKTATVLYPDQGEGAGQGEALPKVAADQPWISPWRCVIAGGLGTLVESSMIDELAPPSIIPANSDWLKFGRAAWVYWAYNHGSRDFQIVKQYIDLAAAMHWPYVLIDWEWDVMRNGGDINDAIAYAKQKNVDVLLWYNSGGKHNWVSGGPRDRLLTHEDRVKEFRWLKSLGVKGIKIDFFESDKQSMMQYYIDILKDAAAEHFLINFHGSTIPRGWARTYPNLVSMEAVYGAEMYNNAGRMTEHGADHNAMLPFTRNVVGSMDYTPVAFTDSQHKHTTKHVHELALPIIFESAITHMADRPASFMGLPQNVKDYLSAVPTVWDETRFIEGYPGKWIVIARRKGNDWYVAGINGSAEERTVQMPNILKSFGGSKAYRFVDTPAGNVFDYKEDTLDKLFPLTLQKKGGFIIHFTAK